MWLFDSIGSTSEYREPLTWLPGPTDVKKDLDLFAEGRTLTGILQDLSLKQTMSHL